MRLAPAVMMMASLLALFLPAARPRLVLNTTSSAPLGLYWIAGKATARVGDWVVVRPRGQTSEWLDHRGYLPAGALLLKRFVAGPGSYACWTPGMLRAEGVQAPLRTLDLGGRLLPAPQGCLRLSASEVLLVNPDPLSLDGRYLGPTSRQWIVGRAAPIARWPLS